MSQYAVPPANSSDEIDLRELACTLWSSKWLILIITLVVTAAAAAYALLTPPTYQVEAQTLPPPLSGLANYNIAYQLSGPAIDALTSEQGSNNKGVDNAIPALTPDGAYNEFLVLATSMTFRRDFFNDVYLPAIGEVKLSSDTNSEKLWKRFNRELNLALPTPKDYNKAFKVQLEGENPEVIARLANQYIKLAIRKTQIQLTNELDSAVNLRLNNIKLQIDTTREFAIADKQNQIDQLKEALQLAKAIGLESPPASGNLITSYTGETMYLRGAHALQGELNLLEARTNNDAHIKNLPNLLKKQTLLQSIDLAPSNLTVAAIDQVATTPDSPIKPKKALIIALGLILGSVMGMLLVLLLHTFRRSSNNH